MKGYFITGTDTGIGKTLTAAILTYALRACYWKPIQTGVVVEQADVERVQQLTALSAEHFFPSVYCFQAPLSPDQAATMEGIEIVIDHCKVPSASRALIVEGAGGVYVPLNKTHNMLDLIKKIALPVIVVARGTLGTINHSLLTIEALRRNDIPIHGIVFNGVLNPANQKAVEQWGKVRTLFHVPFFDRMDAPTIKRWIHEYAVTA